VATCYSTSMVICTYPSTIGQKCLFSANDVSALLASLDASPHLPERLSPPGGPLDAVLNAWEFELL